MRSKRYRDRRWDGRSGVVVTFPIEEIKESIKDLGDMLLYPTNTSK
jgi:hypothetical protein